ncbi:MAG: CpXC domain-containing protein [Spirochaetota bacterium]
MKTITCHCSANVDIDVPDLLDIDADPALFRKLQDGSFLAVVCPHCGATLRPELAVRLKSATRNLDAIVLPEMDRLAVYRGKADVPKGVEILVGYAELFERARILRDDQETRIIEIIKYYLLGRAEEQEPEADIVVLYHGLDNGKLEFHILGMKSGETGIIRLPHESADKAALDTTKQDYRFRELFSSQYRSIRKLGFLAEDERD